jgi:hypothetical protein
VNIASSDCKDCIATAVLPLVWGPHVVAVVQFSAPNVDPLGLYYDLDGSPFSPAGNNGASLEQRDKAIKHMSAVVRDLLDFSEVNADNEFATSFSATAASQQQTVLGRSRTLRAQMMYQVLQLCLELRLDEERSIALMALLSTISELFGRHFPSRASALPAAASDTHHTSPAELSRTGYLDTAHFVQTHSPHKADVTLPHEVDLHGSFVGLASSFNRSAVELRQASETQHTLVEQTQGLSTIVERLKKSRSKYLARSEQLQRDLSVSQDSLEAERATVRNLSHAIKKADAKIKYAYTADVQHSLCVYPFVVHVYRAYEQQQLEITRLNNIMRSAANAALHR